MLQKQKYKKKIDQIRTQGKENHTYPKHNYPIALIMAVAHEKNIKRSVTIKTT